MTKSQQVGTRQGHDSPVASSNYEKEAALTRLDLEMRRIDLERWSWSIQLLILCRCANFVSLLLGPILTLTPHKYMMMIFLDIDQIHLFNIQP